MSWFVTIEHDQTLLMHTILGPTLYRGTEIDGNVEHYCNLGEEANSQECKDLVGTLIKYVESYL